MQDMHDVRVQATLAVAADVPVARPAVARASGAPPSRTSLRRPFPVTAAVVLLVLVLVNVGIQLNRRYFDVLSSGGFGDEPDLLKVQECESLGRTPDVLFMGSSRAENGAAAPVVDQAVHQQFGIQSLSCNIGMSGSTFESDYFAFKRMIEDGYAPKLVVENVFEYNVNANGGADSYAPAVHHSIWLADLSDIGDLRASYPGWSGLPSIADFAAQKLIPLYGDRIGILKSLCRASQIGPCATQLEGVSWACRNCYKTDPYLGWHPLTDRSLALHTPDEQQALAQELNYFRNNYLQNFKLLDHPPEFLTKLIELAQVNHVKVALVVSPLHKLYRDLLPATQWHAIMRYWSGLADRYGVSFYDESQAAGYTDADFRDPHHLSASGAEKFAVWMAQNIVGPALAAHPITNS